MAGRLKSQRRQHRSWPKRPDNFRVASVNNKKVGLVVHQVLDHGQQHMRVDGSDAGIDNLELCGGKAFSEHHLQVSAKSVARIGIPQATDSPNTKIL
jgi:hypothetical protein